MAGYPFFDPRIQIIDANGVPQPNAYLRAYDAGTDTEAAVYEDAALNTIKTQPLVADAAGYIPLFYMDPDVSYKVRTFKADDSPIWTADDYQIPNIGTSSSSTIYHEIAQTRTGAIASGASILYYEVAQPFTLPAGLETPDSRAECKTAPSGGTAQFTLKKNGSNIGTITFADGESSSPAFVLSSDTDFVAGDILEVEATSTLNGIEDVTLTLLGSYQES